MALIPAVYVTIEDKSFAMPNPGNGRYGLIPLISDRGPHNRVIEINSQSELYETFGRPFFDRTGHGHYLADKFLQHSNRLLVVRPVLFPSTAEFEQSGDYLDEPFNLNDYASIANIGVRYRTDADSVDKINARNDENDNTFAFSFKIPARFNTDTETYEWYSNVAEKTITAATFDDVANTIVYTSNNHGFVVGQVVTISGIIDSDNKTDLDTPFNKENAVIIAANTNTFTVSELTTVTVTRASGGKVECTELTDWITNKVDKGYFNCNVLAVNSIAYEYFNVGDYIIPYVNLNSDNYFGGNNRINIARRIVDKQESNGIYTFTLAYGLNIPTALRSNLLSNHVADLDYIRDPNNVYTTPYNRQAIIAVDIAEKYFAGSKTYNHWCTFAFTQNSDQVRVNLRREAISAILADVDYNTADSSKDPELLYAKANYTQSSIADTALYEIALKLYTDVTLNFHRTDWIFPGSYKINFEKPLSRSITGAKFTNKFTTIEYTVPTGHGLNIDDEIYIADVVCDYPHYNPFNRYTNPVKIVNKTDTSITIEYTTGYKRATYISGGQIIEPSEFLNNSISCIDEFNLMDSHQIIDIKIPSLMDSTQSGSNKWVAVNTIAPSVGTAKSLRGDYTDFSLLYITLDQKYTGESVVTIGARRRPNLVDVTTIPYLRDSLNSTEYLSKLITDATLSNFSATEDATSGGPSFNKEDLDYLWNFYAVGAGSYYNDLYLVGVRNLNLEKMWIDDREPEIDPATGKRDYESSTTYGTPLYKYAFMDLYLYRQNLDGTSSLVEGPWAVSLIRTTNTGQVIRDIYTGRELYIETVINELSKNIRCVSSLGSNILLTGSLTDVANPAFAEILRLNVLALFSVDRVFKTDTNGYGGIRFEDGRDGAQYDSRGKINITAGTKMAGRVGQIFAGQLESPDGTIEKLRDTLYPLFQIDYVISAGWDPDTQAKAREFVDVRQDCMLLADTGKITTSKAQDILEKQRNDWNTWNAMVYTQYRRMFDSFTGKYLWMSPVYHAIERHLYCDNQYWIAEPVAGIEKGAIQDPIRLAYKPNQTDLEDLLDYNLNPVIVEPEGTYILTQFTTWKRLSIMKRAHAVKFVHFVKKRLPTLLKDILQRKMTSYWINLANQRINTFLSRYVDGANGVSERYTAITSFSVEVNADEARSELNILLTLKLIRAIEAINVHIVVV